MINHPFREETPAPHASAGVASGGQTVPERPRNDMVPIIGVPGYPVSAALTIDIFVEPLIATWLGTKT